MPTVQIGKYKRPGIFIEEFDNSVIETPIVTGIQTIVFGVSRKGPVNTPIELASQTDLANVFGDLDRNLEAKGSYFHRTISKVLESSPVIGFNLLNPDDTLDTLEYKSLSTSTGYTNDVERTAPYRRFFDTSTFWKRDREAFLSITSSNPNDANRILHLTNMSDKQVTVFVVKSSRSGFDTTLLEWYGSVDQVPLYVDPNDFASDYLVDVVIVNGDWTDYSSLSVDPIWSNYFNNTGLIKSQLENFYNDQRVNTLRVWNGLSLIPFFRDANGTDIFIETRINQDTDTTGVFCAYDIDAVETTYRNGLLDLLGNTLINDDSSTSVDFLSYQDDIVTQNTFAETKLDRAGNGYMAAFNSYYQTNSGNDREALYTEGFVWGVSGLTATGFGSFATGASTSISFTASAAAGGGDGRTISPFAVVGGQGFSMSTTSFTVDPNDFTLSASSGTQRFTEVYFVDTDGVIKRNPTAAQLGSGIVLGYNDITILIDSGSQSINAMTYTPISVDTAGFKYFDSGDITATVNTNQDTITYEFIGTSGTADVNDYAQYRIWKVYNQFIGVLNSSTSDRATILFDEGTNSNGNPWKKSISDLTVTITSESTANNTIALGGFGTGSLSSTILNTNGLVLHVTDDEMIAGLNGMITTENWASTTQGVIAEWSQMYQDYEDGLINTGDYFYENLADGFDNTAENTGLTAAQFLDDNGTDYIVFSQTLNLNTSDIIRLPESTLNTGNFTVANATPVTTGLTVSFSPYFAYEVTENTVAETLSDVTKVWDINQKHHLRFQKNYDTNVLTVDFTDSTFTSTATSYNKTFDVFSQLSNFRQTVEIEEPTGYATQSNIVLVDGTRYNELKIGDFLEAHVDESALQAGEIPRRLTRILSKKQFSGDASLLEITCDSAIKIYNFNGDKQTYRFTTIDDYVSTYKGIELFGFRVREESLPDGTDTRLDEILQIIGKGTPLYNALTDKDVIDYRYLVDSFGLGLTELSKQELADICGKRLDCFGILNMPSMKQFRNSSSPSFVDSEGRLRTEFIALGGDPESSPAFNYSFAEGDGETSVGYFTPFVVVNDNGRRREVPPAAWVATTFLRKHNSSIASVTPWTIAAGVTNGQVTGIAGLEYDFTSEDIENLHGMKANPIVSKRNRGRVIETDNTAQDLTTSALSFIHVREVLIELERQLSAMLLNFQWQFNTPEIRAEIKLRADAICEDFVNRNGLFNFFNKCDSENNTQEIIDNQHGVLDTYVEPIKGMGIIVNNITILRTGAIDSGGFL